MKNFWLTIAILGSLLLGLSACAAAETAATAGTAVPASADAETAVETNENPLIETVEVVESSSCASESGRVFNGAEGTYCFVYPEDYCWFPGQDATINTFISVASADAESNRCPDEPLILHGDVVWVRVEVAPANGLALADAIAGFTAGLEDFGLEIEEVTLAGETAVQITNMPGQDISRELFAVHEDQLFHLTFVPTGADKLYKQVTTSFQFLP